MEKWDVWHINKMKIFVSFPSRIKVKLTREFYLAG